MKVKYWLLIAFVVFVAGGLYWLFMIPASVAPSGPASIALYQPGPYEVVSEDFSLVDNSRDTPANREIPAHSGRTLNGMLWRPEGIVQPRPLLVHSHGFTSTHLEALYLAKFLASHGYTVVAVDYPLTSYTTPGQPLVTDVINQPGDVSFIINNILKRSTTEGDSLYNTIDPQRIAASGISLGGLTTTLVTFHQKYRDPRIKAAVSIAGPSMMLLPTFFTDIDTPYLAIYGDGDVVIPYAANGKPLVQKRPGTTLVTLKGGSHAGFIQLGSTAMRFMSNPDTIGCKFVLENLADSAPTEDDDFIRPLGDASLGIDTAAKVEICATAPPVPAMQSARQHMFSTLAIYSFLNSLFNADADARRASADYLQNTLARENSSEVSVEKQ